MTGAVFENLTQEELCGLMCGGVELDGECTAEEGCECGYNCEACKYYEEK